MSLPDSNGANVLHVHIPPTVKENCCSCCLSCSGDKTRIGTKPDIGAGAGPSTHSIKHHKAVSHDPQRVVVVGQGADRERQHVIGPSIVALHVQPRRCLDVPACCAAVSERQVCDLCGNTAIKTTASYKQTTAVQGWCAVLFALHASHVLGLQLSVSHCICKSSSA